MAGHGDRHLEAILQSNPSVLLANHREWHGVDTKRTQLTGRGSMDTEAAAGGSARLETPALRSMTSAAKFSPVTGPKKDFHWGWAWDFSLWRLQVRMLSHSELCQTLVTLSTIAHQSHLSMEFSRQEYWSGLLFPLPGNLPDPGIEPAAPALQAVALPSESPGKLLSKGEAEQTYHEWSHQCAQLQRPQFMPLQPRRQGSRC